MRILLLDVNYDHSSTGKIVKDLETGLTLHGHSTMVCYGRDVAGLRSAAVAIADPWEVYAHVALTRVTGKTGIYSPFATKKFISIVEEFKPDIVHLHELHGYYINFLDVIEHLKKQNIPTVWTFHCEFMYTGKCGYTYDCEQWKTECRSCPQLREYPETWIFDRTNEMFKEKRASFLDFSALKILTPSHWLADRVKQSFLSGSDIEVVYNGIDVEETFLPRSTARLREELGITTRHVVVSIGPDLMSDRKGGHWVLEVASRMLEEDVTFVMVGISEPEKIMSANVIAIPRVNDQKLLSEYYSLGDFFLLTSKKETFSLVCAESLACGTPIIGFDSGAPTEVAPFGYGCFVDYADVDTLSKLLSKSLIDRSWFFNAEECSKYARDNFGKNAMIASHLRVYSEMIDGL